MFCSGFADAVAELAVVVGVGRSRNDSHAIPTIESKVSPMVAATRAPQDHGREAVRRKFVGLASCLSVGALVDRIDGSFA
jgi:hypothetical protein